MTPKQLLGPSRPPTMTPDTRGVSLAHYHNRNFYQLPTSMCHSLEMTFRALHMDIHHWYYCHLFMWKRVYLYQLLQFSLISFYFSFYFTFITSSDIFAAL